MWIKSNLKKIISWELDRWIEVTSNEVQSIFKKHLCGYEWWLL